MKRRLLASYLGVALLLLSVLELPIGVLAGRFERELATNQAARDANGLAVVAGEYAEERHPLQLAVVARSYQARTGGEVVVVGADGKLAAASSSDADSDVGYLWRAQLRQAIAGRSNSGFASDEGEPYALAAVPVQAEGRPLGAVLVANPADQAERRVGEVWVGLGLFALVALGLAALVGNWVARSLVEPLGRLESAVARLGRGDLAVRAADRAGAPEVRSLARSFNLMATRLEELVGAQQRFVAEASHQLRSPLTAMRLRLENLEAVAGPGSSANFKAASRELARLSRLVDGLLTLGRAGQERPARVPVDIRALLDERTAAWSALAGERDVVLRRLDEADPGPLLLVEGDLEQILDNVLANALEVSPPGGTIEVSLRRVDGLGLELHVADEGPGMSEEDRKRAFDRFWQSPSRPTGHSGLGLAIVSQLAARNDLGVELRPNHPKGLDAVVSFADTEQLRRTTRRPGRRVGKVKDWKNLA